jgi:hypothetical protein
MSDTLGSVVLEEVTVLYPNLFVPTVPKGSTPGTEAAYSLVVLLPPDYDMAPLNKLALDAATAKFGSDAQRLITAGVIKSPFRNQMEKAAQGKAGYSDDPKAKYISCKSSSQPGVVDQQAQPVLDPARIYGGVICNVQVNCFGWSHPTGGKGLSFGLQNVQIVRDGPKLGNQNPDPKKVFKPLAPPQESATADANMKTLFG